jgi:S1-C subfamily serine protease
MRSTAKFVSIAFIAGLLGAFIFQEFFSAPVTNVIREAPAQFETANYEPKEDYPRTPNFAAPDNFRAAAANSISSVVYIKNIQTNQRSYSFMDQFFGRSSGSRGGDDVVTGSGSGVIYSSDGYIITNNHVIAGAKEIQVMHEKRTYTATLVGTDPTLDIAVLKIDTKGLPAIKLAKSGEVAIGDWVLAVGNPFNLTSTVTAGIVSAIGSETTSVRENFPIELYIQTDAAINPGNSGGALVNTAGELVGINTSIISRTGSYAGYGFAVPSDVVIKAVEDLKKYKFVQKAFTGAEILDINDVIAREEGLKDLNGVFIESVKKGSAADEAGLESGDVVLKVNNTFINSKAAFDEVLSAMSPGDKVNIVFNRNKRILESQLTLENVFGNTDILDETSGLSEEDIYFSNFLGAELRKLTQSELDKYNLKYGVKITKIDQKAGFLRELDDLKEGQIITAINRRYASDPSAVANYIEQYSGRIYIDIINSKGRSETIKYIFR